MNIKLACIYIGAVLTCIANSAPSFAQTIQQIEAPSAFTLTYRVTDSDVRTRAEKLKELADSRITFANNVKFGHMTQSAMDQFMKFLSKKITDPPPPTVSVQTLSVRNGTLFYRKQCEWDPREDFVLITGGNQWFMHAGYNHMGTFASDPAALRGDGITEFVNNFETIWYLNFWSG